MSMGDQDHKIKCDKYVAIISNTIDKLQCSINNTLTNPQSGFGITPIQPYDLYGVSNGTAPDPIWVSVAPSFHPPTIQVQYSAGLTPEKEKLPVDASDVLKFACMVGKRMLIKSTVYSYHGNEIVEIKVLEFAPSYDFVKVQYPTGGCSWHESVKFLKQDNKILEILDIEDKEGKADDKDSGMPKL